MVTTAKFRRNNMGLFRQNLNLYSSTASCSLDDRLPGNGLVSITFPLTVITRPEIQKTPEGHPEHFWSKIEVRRGYNLEVQFAGQGMWGGEKLHSSRAMQVSSK